MNIGLEDAEEILSWDVWTKRWRLQAPPGQSSRGLTPFSFARPRIAPWCPRAAAPFTLRSGTPLRRHCRALPFEEGVLSHAYDPAIHVLIQCFQHTSRFIPGHSRSKDGVLSHAYARQS